MTYTPGRAVFPRSVKVQVLAEEPVCRGCHLRPATEVDHVVPVAFGGSNTRDNAQGLCDECHLIKSRAEAAEGARRAAARSRFETEGNPGDVT